jgi:hypothetical protein
MLLGPSLSILLSIARRTSTEIELSSFVKFNESRLFLRLVLGVLPLYEELLESLRPKCRSIMEKYCFSMGRQVQISPVFASITLQFVAGTGPSRPKCQCLDAN